jgi:hypothetical protein
MSQSNPVNPDLLACVSPQFGVTHQNPVRYGKKRLTTLFPLITDILIATMAPQSGMGNLPRVVVVLILVISC